MLQWMDDHVGMFDSVTDRAYVMDDFGNAIQVEWSLPEFWFNNYDYS